MLKIYIYIYWITNNLRFRIIQWRNANVREKIYIYFGSVGSMLISKK